MELSSLRSIIRERRTIRSFTDKDITTDVILELLNDAVYAPTHKLREPWSFLLIRDKAKEEFLDHVMASQLRVGNLSTLTPEELEGKKMKWRATFSTCPVHVIVFMDTSDSQKVWEENFGATSALIQNLQLLAWEKGIGMVWKTNQYIYDPQFYKDMQLDQSKKIVGVLHIGYPDEVPKVTPRKDALSKLEIRS